MPAVQFLPTTIPDVRQLLLPRFADARGWFAETCNPASFAAAFELLEGGKPVNFVQDNQSFSHANVLRGLHYQLGKPQGKLIRVLSGRIFDVALDLRKGSPTFGRHAAVELAAPAGASEPLRALWIPEGFAHGFYVPDGPAEVLYKTTAPYYPAGERTILWNDPDLDIRWPVDATNPPILSVKDAAGLSFREAEKLGAVFA
jgi:dTDP-4-dehydrorhamnose 3,5-epimerase